MKQKREERPVQAQRNKRPRLVLTWIPKNKHQLAGEQIQQGKQQIKDQQEDTDWLAKGKNVVNVVEENANSG